MSDHSIESETDDPQDEPVANTPMVERRRWPREPNVLENSDDTSRPALTSHHFSTRNLAPREQFAAWQGHMSSLFEVALPDGRSAEDGFPVDQTAWNMGKLLLVRQSVPAHSYIRPLSMLRKSTIDHWFVELLRSGRAWTEADQRVAASSPGLFAFRSLGYPYRGRMTDAEGFWLFMPYDLMADHAALLEAGNNSIFTGTLAKLLLNHVTGVESNLTSLKAGELPQLVRTISDLVVACASSSVATVSPSTFRNMGMMERAHRYIHNNLNSGQLTPESICRSVGLSRTRLYQLFAASGGVLNYIRKRRLLAAYADLSDATNTRPISEIAEAAGFDLAANFSRAFHHEFGVNPRDIRKAAAQQRVPLASPPGIRHGGSFAEWLSGLGT